MRGPIRMTPSPSTPSETKIIRLENTVKTFGSTRALDGLDLTVTEGEVHGFLGPNGAGKSTTIRVILGLIQADSGTMTLFGDDPWRHAPTLHQRLAYVPGDVALWPGLTGGQCIDVLGRAQGSLNPARRAELIDRFDLDPSKKSRDYSKGNRQKVSLIAALAADADLLILDEPTSGLDPLMENVFQQVVRERVADGATVLLSSHIMGEVEALADRVSIIKKGKNIVTGSLVDLRKSTHSQVHATTRNDVSDLPNDATTTPNDAGFDIRMSVEPDQLDGVLGVLRNAGLVSLTVTPPSLDELFLSMYAPGDDTDNSAEATR